MSLFERQASGKSLDGVERVDAPPDSAAARHYAGSRCWVEVVGVTPADAPPAGPELDQVDPADELPELD